MNAPEPLPRHAAAGREIRCRLCQQQCAAYITGALSFADPREWCPSGRWPIATRLSPSAPFGLGDAVAAVAQPIARAIDRTAAAVGASTNVAGCGGCKQRRATLNALVPDLRHPLD